MNRLIIFSYFAIFKVILNNKIINSMKQFCELLSKLKSNVIKLFSNNNTEENKEPNNTDNSKKHIMSLVPVIIDKEEDGKPNKAYSAVEDIANALKEKEIRNIALTGSYGSGKSSVLKTLQEDNTEYTYLNISLATLKDNKDNNPNEKDVIIPNVDQNKNKTQKNDKDKTSGDNEINRLIEYSILQQIIYKENIDSLPQSRFKRIKNIDSKKSKKYSLFAIAFLLSIIVLFEPKFLRITWIYECLSYKWLNIIFDGISIVYILWVLFQLGIKLIVRLCNNKLNKFNIKECAIEINEETSIFNKHLDEILYFFEVTKYDVVIIEDLDRFDTQDIFLKLRELNQIINESKSINRKIVFIYAVRDDIFKDRNRTKFFDYIVTVISVINSHNSCDRLLKDIDKLQGKESFCNDIGLYIDDMRILINIKNEFDQFKRRLGDDSEENLKDENLFAMIVYKNYFPDDFSKLQNKDGLVYNAITNKDKYIQQVIDEKENEIENKNKEIEHLDSYKIKNEKELRSLYVMKYLEKIPQIQGFTSRTDNAVYTIEQVIDNEKVFELLIKDQLNYRRPNHYNQFENVGLGITFKEIEKQVDENNNYKTRLDICDHNLVDVYRRKIEELKNDIIKIKGMSLKEMASKYGNIIFKETFNEDQELIQFLLTKGYIDENYNNYISYFYPGRLTSGDNKFIRNIALGKLETNEQYEYNIEKPESTIDAINDFDFSNKNILNHNILDALAKNKSKGGKTKEEGYFNDIIDLIIKEHPFDFIISYFNQGNNQQTVFYELFKIWNNYWECIFNNVDNEITISSLLTLYLKFLPSNDLIKKADSDTLKKLLEKNYNLIFKYKDSIIIDNARRITEQLSLKYDDISLKDNDDIFLEYVIDNKNYKLNRNNLNAIFNYYNTDKLDFEKATYSYVLTIKNQNVIDYINKNKEKCLNELFHESSIEENEDVLIQIINWGNDLLLEETKEKYLSKQQNKIQNINSIEKEYWDLAIKINIILPSWNNIYQYYSSKENQINKSLSDFIVNNEDALISDNSINEFKNGESIILFKALFTSNILPIKTYKKLISVCYYYFEEDNDLSSLDEERMKILVKNDKLQFNEGIYKLLNDNSDRSLLRLYAIDNKLDYISNIIKYQIEISDAIYFLESEKFSDEEKIEIIKSFTVDFLKDNVQLADIIYKLIINNSLIGLDNNFIIKIISLCTKEKIKLQIILLFLDENEYNQDVITYLLNTLGEPYSKISDIDAQKYLIPKNDLTEKLISYLFDKEYISSFKTEEDGIRVNTEKSL